MQTQPLRLDSPHPTQLFISYARESVDKVRHAVDVFKAGGHAVWFDEDLLPWQDWKQTEYRNLDLSPDGKYAAFDRGSSAGADVFVLDLERVDRQVYALRAAWMQRPLWSPNGQSIVYMSSRDPAGGTASIGNVGAGNLYARGVGVVAEDTRVVSAVLRTDRVVVRTNP